MVHIIFIFHTKSRWNPTLWLLNDVCCQSNFHCWAFRLVLAPQWCTIFILYSYYLHLHVNTSRHTTTNHNGCVPPDFCFHDISPCYNEAYAPVGVTCKHPPRRPVKALPKVGPWIESKWHLQPINAQIILDWNLPSCVFIYYTPVSLPLGVKWIMGGMAMARRCQNTTTSTEAGDPRTLVMTSGWEFIGLR